MVKKISKYVTTLEAIKSNTAARHGIDNTPSIEALDNMRNLGAKFFDPLRKRVKQAVYISSFYRSKALNTKLGGAKGSDHLTGEAIDIDMDIAIKSKLSNNDIFHIIRKEFRFYKLIAEYPVDGILKWVHVSYMKDDALNDKKTILIAVRENGKTKYLNYDDHKNLVQ